MKVPNLETVGVSLYHLGLFRLVCHGRFPGVAVKMGGFLRFQLRSERSFAENFPSVDPSLFSFQARQVYLQVGNQVDVANSRWDGGSEVVQTTRALSFNRPYWFGYFGKTKKNCGIFF